MVNISELLKDAPKGMKLYSPLFGEVTLVCVNCDNNILVETEMHDNHYFAYNGVFRMSGCYPHSECLLFPAKGQSWEGWKLPIAPKFKVGDWIVRSNGSSDVPIQVYGLKRGRYLVTNMLGSKCELMINRQDEWHLWTILDVIDGDVLALNGKPFIYSHNKYGKNYCYIDDCGQFRVNFNLVLEGNCVWPATKQERDLLFSKMREVGYEWDADKKELRKIQPHYDLVNFQPFDKVLGRDNNGGHWEADFFSRIRARTDSSIEFKCVKYSWRQCIPFNEYTKHLLGTTDMPSEEYINW